MSHPTAQASRSFVMEFCLWDDCEVIADHPDHPLCNMHYRRVGLLFIHDHIDLVREAVDQVSGTDRLARLVDQHKAAVEEARPGAVEAGRLEAERRRQLRRTAGVVYYVRLSEHIKIGTTIDLRRRMVDLCAGPGALLATEGGGEERERQRHRQFADEQFRGELFEPSDRLLEHIASLQP